jgi:HK97 family phage portal protein
MTPFQFKHHLAVQVETWGNAYVEIQRDLQGRAMWLWPITADRVTPKRTESGAIVYEVANAGGASSSIEAANMLHIRGMGFDGLVGYSPIRMAAESIGLGQAMENFGASFFKNGANMGGILSHPQKLGKDGKKNLEESLQKNHSGAKAGRWMVLEEGMTAQRMSVPPDEAQFLESRKFQVEEICRWFGVPPHKVGALDRATWNNIEHQALEFVTDTIQPLVTQIEEEANLKLFGRVNRGVLYSKFNMAALLRGDSKSRWEVYEIAHRNGLLSADEVRAFEELNPLPKGLGKIYVMQGQMVTREHVKDGKQETAQPPELDAPPETTDPIDRLTAARMLNMAKER